MVCSVGKLQQRQTTVLPFRLSISTSLTSSRAEDRDEEYGKGDQWNMSTQEQSNPAKHNEDQFIKSAI